MTIKDMKSILSTNKFDHIECNFKLKTGKPKVTLESLSQTVESLAKTLQDVIIEMRQGFAKQEQFNKVVIQRLDKIDSRIDNLVSKNNLKE